jgi:arsenate reductase
MAEGLLRHLTDGAVEVFSAGVEPSSIRPEAVEAMSEISIDISGHRSKSVDEFAGQEFDYVITVCDNAVETCPVFPGMAKRIHQAFDDPPKASVTDYQTRLEVFRRVRDELEDWLKGFVEKENLS